MGVFRMKRLLVSVSASGREPVKVRVRRVEVKHPLKQTVREYLEINQRQISNARRRLSVGPEVPLVFEAVKGYSPLLPYSDGSRMATKLKV